MGLISFLYNLSNNNDNSNGLDSLEQEEVNNGNYEPYNFEEEELEEDDYYSEDDE